MKILCMYLPQYHKIEENDIWWGDGYTEWTAVKQAKPIYEGHYQPKVPLEGYYDLHNEFKNTFIRQAQLMNEYGLYGFCFYHYWFSGKKLMEKPLELLLSDSTIDLKFSLCWANETWTRTWDGNEKEILIEQKYGDNAEWIDHYNYLNKYFKDSRYIKINNKPLIHIYKSADIPCLQEMMDCWNELAQKNGFEGLYVVVGNTMGEIETRKEAFDAYYNFEPGYTLRHKRNLIRKNIYFISCFIKIMLNKYCGLELLEHKLDCKELYKYITKKSRKLIKNKKTYYGIFPMWDNTPRRKYKGTVVNKCSPQLFKENLKKIKDLSSVDDFIYINAWNEWSEGAYLEADKKYEYEYLQAIKEVLVDE